MKRICTFSLGASFLFLLAGGSLSFGQTNDFLSHDYTKERLTASFGVISALEPQVSEAESKLIKNLSEDIISNPKTALNELQGKVNAQSSAALDFILGNLYFQTDNYERARSSYKEAIRKFPDFRRAWKNLGMLECRMDNMQGAIDALSKAISLGDFDSRCYGMLAYAYSQKERWLSAETAYRQAILADAENEDWKLGLAYALNMSGRTKEAIALFAELIKKNPARESYWLYQANGFLASGEPMRAAENLEVVRAMGKSDTRTLKLLAAIYFNENMHARALDIYREVFRTVASGGAEKENDKDLLEVTERFIMVDAFDEAEELFAILNQRDLNGNDDFLLRRDIIAAQIMQNKGDTVASGKLFEKVLERDPLNGIALLALADTSLVDQKNEMAKIYLERALKQDKFAYAANIKLAQIYVNEQNYETALEYVESAMSIKSSKSLEDYANKLHEMIGNKTNE